jgi:transcriptional regulator with XRE-family HTH domain
MSKKQVKIFPKQRPILESLGERIRLARKRRKLSMDTVANRANMTRLTLSRAEKGDPQVSMGNYFRILSVLHLSEDFDKIASDDPWGRKLQDMDL